MTSFAEKLLQARTWTRQTRISMQAEVLQWQAAIATVEAENEDQALHRRSPEHTSALFVLPDDQSSLLESDEGHDNTWASLRESSGSVNQQSTWPPKEKVQVRCR